MWNQSATLSTRLFLPILLSILLGTAGVTWAGDFADTVNEFIPGGDDLHDVNGCSQLLPSCDALGPSDLRYVSLGELGSITLSFSERMIVDGPGDDLIVYTVGNAPNEPGRIYASSDGINFTALGDYTSPSGGVGFDLADAGLTYALLIRIDDLPGGGPNGLAFDVDALEAIYIDGAVQLHSDTWGRLKASYR
jgi:hypothetical protein